MRRGDLFVLSWESLRRVEWGKVSSFLSIYCLYIVFEAVEISGDVACWLRFVGILVGVFVFSTI